MPACFSKYRHLLAYTLIYNDQRWEGRIPPLYLGLICVAISQRDMIEDRLRTVGVAKTGGWRSQTSTWCGYSKVLLGERLSKAIVRRKLAEFLSVPRAAEVDPQRRLAEPEQQPSKWKIEAGARVRVVSLSF
jgi:hypothetical protein